jgi:serine/threonine protein kinase
VAIKFLGEEFSRHPKALISLQREAKKSQQLAHPNVLTVYDFDRDGDRVYMTMEMLQGDALSGLKKITFAEGKEPSNETLIEQMASGLAYAHENGLVHSDFKPDNVFVTTEGRVKILDFGIARIMDSAVQKDSFDAGELGAMTLRYASLEMLRRDSDPHPADDVYALGLIAYQLYAGSHPYGGRTALDALGVPAEADGRLCRGERVPGQQRAVGAAAHYPAGAVEREVGRPARGARLGAPGYGCPAPSPSISRNSSGHACTQQQSWSNVSRTR